jgi:hypothetical protein
MKNVILATAVTFGLATAASAEGLLPVPIMGSIEYATEAAVTSVDLGTELSFGDLTLSNNFNLSDASGEIAFDGLEVTASYGVFEGVGVYAIIETNKDLEYSEGTVGVSFKF